MNCPAPAATGARWRNWADYTIFHDAAIASRDVDPVYPVLRHIAVSEGWEREATVRAILLHVAYYDMGSALTAAHMHLNLGVPFAALPPDLPCATERRNHRHPRKLHAHLTDLEVRFARYGSARTWLDAPMVGDPGPDFEHVARQLALAYGNGRWAAYKTTEMLWKVADYPLKADTLAMDDATGPKQGLALLAPSGYPLSEATAQALVTDLKAAGHPAAPEEVETTLCDFHALARGSYYVGHDVDQMQQQLGRAAFNPLHNAAWAARSATIPHAYLGERQGWQGVDRARKRVYRDTGRVLLRSDG